MNTTKLNKLADRLDNADAPYSEGSSSVNSKLCEYISDAADAIRAMAKLIDEAHAAGFITDEGKVRKVLGTLPITADGCVIGHGALIHGYWDDGEPGWTSRSSVRVDMEDWNKPECGGFYSTRDAAEAARGEK